MLLLDSFLEGDPDRPIITGRVYNGEHKPPYKLPENATQSGIKTRSSKGGKDSTFNEIRFEDKKGEEALHIHAEKDFTVDVENDATLRVGLNEDSPAKSSKGVAKFEIGKTMLIDVGDEITLVTGQSKIVMKKNGDITVTCKNLTVKASDSINMKASRRVKIKGQQEVAVKGLNVGVKGDVSAKVEGGMLDLKADAIASLKGSLTKIG
jgi:type VI secretion system secreted protein VgrG